MAFTQALVAATAGNDALPGGHGIGSSKAATQDAAEAAKDVTTSAGDGAEAAKEAGVDAAGDTAMAEASESMIDGPEVPEIPQGAVAEVPQDAMAELLKDVTAELLKDATAEVPLAEVPKDAAVTQEPSSSVAAVEAGTPAKPVGSASPEEDKPGWAS